MNNFISQVMGSWQEGGKQRDHARSCQRYSWRRLTVGNSPPSLKLSPDMHADFSYGRAWSPDFTSRKQMRALCPRCSKLDTEPWLEGFISELGEVLASCGCTFRS